MSTDLYKSATVFTAATKGSQAPQRPLNATEQQALAEAAQRRAAAAKTAEALPKEHHGRGGLDPARFGDWEVKGIASDF